MPYIFYSRLPRTPKEAAAIVSTSNLSLIQNLPEGDKTKMAYKLAYSMFKVAFILYLISYGRGDVFALGNSFKEMDTLKGKTKPMKLKCVNLQNELLALQLEVKVVNSLQEVVTTHGSPSSLAAYVAKLKDALKG